MGLFYKEEGIPVSNIRLIDFLSKVERKDPQNDVLLGIYKRHGANTPKKLVLELRKDASNTIGWWVTGPVDYNIVVQRVALKIGIEKSDLRVSEIENELLIMRKLMQDYLKKNPDAKEKLDQILKEMGREYSDFYSLLISGSATAFIAFTQEAAPFMISKMLIAIFTEMNALAGFLLASRIAGMVVPFLNLVMGAWLIIDISGPAYRKIVPTVCEIALLRIIDNGAENAEG